MFNKRHGSQFPSRSGLGKTNSCIFALEDSLKETALRQLFPGNPHCSNRMRLVTCSTNHCNRLNYVDNKNCSYKKPRRNELIGKFKQTSVHKKITNKNAQIITYKALIYASKKRGKLREITLIKKLAKTEIFLSCLEHKLPKRQENKKGKPNTRSNTGPVFDPFSIGKHIHYVCKYRSIKYKNYCEALSMEKCIRDSLNLTVTTAQREKKRLQASVSV